MGWERYGFHLCGAEIDSQGLVFHVGSAKSSERGGALQGVVVWAGRCENASDNDNLAICNLIIHVIPLSFPTRARSKQVAQNSAPRASPCPGWAVASSRDRNFGGISGRTARLGKPEGPE